MESHRRIREDTGPVLSDCALLVRDSRGAAILTVAKGKTNFYFVKPAERLQWQLGEGSDFGRVFGVREGTDMSAWRLIKGLFNMRESRKMVENIKQSQVDLDQRLDKLTTTIKIATMNGENFWFLKKSRRTESDDD